MLADDINKLYESCATYEQLKAEITALLKNKGKDTSEKRLKVLLGGLFGGTRVEINQDGNYANKWRRKFYPKLEIEQIEEHIMPDGTKVVTMLGLTAEQLQQIDNESEQMRRKEKAWEAKGSPWTDDDEALLNRMSS